MIAVAMMGTTVSAHADITSAGSLDDTDRQDRQDALDRLLATPPGNDESWSNIDSGNHGDLRSLSERPGDGGETCRDIAETVSLADSQESGKLVVCRIGTGPWRITTSSLEPTPRAPEENSQVSQPPGLQNMPIQVWVGAPRNSGTTTVTPQTPAAQ